MFKESSGGPPKKATTRQDATMLGQERHDPVMKPAVEVVGGAGERRGGTPARGSSLCKGPEARLQVVPFWGEEEDTQWKVLLLTSPGARLSILLASFYAPLDDLLAPVKNAALSTIQTAQVHSHRAWRVNSRLCLAQSCWEKLSRMHLSPLASHLLWYLLSDKGR